MLSRHALRRAGVPRRRIHAERFDVLDPHRHVPADGLASVTVIGPSLTWADGYATAALAMGLAAPDWLAGLDGYEALVVDAGGAACRTPGFPMPSRS